jgi:phospholipid-transporting ATPase
MILYTGKDTKLSQNLGQYHSKRSSLETRVNRILAFNFFMLLLIAAFMAIGNNIMSQKLESKHHYTYEGTSHTELSVSAFFSFIIIMNSMIPMDLVVGLEAIYMIGR